MMNSISYAILSCNEVNELRFLLELLNNVKRKEDEIVVLLDKDNYNKYILNYIYDLADIVEFNPLNKDFSQQKNKLIEFCSKDYILNLDADEYIYEKDLKNIPKFLEVNKNIDLFYFSRINTVNGITLEHINKWQWKISKNNDYKGIIKKPFDYEKYKEFIKLLKLYNYIIQDNDELIEYYEPIINYPDIQGRLWKNNNKIKWRSKVHERLSGFKKVAILPIDILHYKEINKQEQQNKFYKTI